MNELDVFKFIKNIFVTSYLCIYMYEIDVYFFYNIDNGELIERERERITSHSFRTVCIHLRYIDECFFLKKNIGRSFK